MSWRNKNHRRPDRHRDEQTEMVFTPAGMRTFGHWTEIGCADKLRRRLVVRCKCGQTATVSLEVLMSGESTSCGCVPLTAKQGAAMREETAQRQRQRDLRWKPGDRS
jgi:hypothetical protein